MYAPTERILNWDHEFFALVHEVLPHEWDTVVLPSREAHRTPEETVELLMKER